MKKSLSLRSLLSLSFILACIGCGGDSPTSSTPVAPPPPSQASISVSVSPNPVIVESSPDPHFSWMAAWSVNFRESAGVSFNVDFINATMRDQTTGLELGTLNWGAADVIRASGTNHVNAMGTLSVPQSVIYTLPYGGRQGTITIAAQCTDERGNVMNVTSQFNVTLVASSIGQ